MSTSIADALATFTKSVLQTVSCGSILLICSNSSKQADIECRAQAEVARAIDDAFKARNEREEAARSRHSMELEVQRLELTVSVHSIQILRFLFFLAPECRGQGMVYNWHYNGPLIVTDCPTSADDR